MFEESRGMAAAMEAADIRDKSDSHESRMERLEARMESLEDSMNELTASLVEIFE